LDVDLQPDDDGVFVGLDGLRSHCPRFAARWLKANGAVADVEPRGGR
jgi:hypothetical protein